MKILSGGKIFMNNELKEADIGIEKDRIVKIGKDLKGEIINCQNRIIIPGIIDTHVHFRDFKQSQKEDWATGSRAAAKGGVTTVFDMPNNNPPIIDKKTLSEKKTISKKINN